MMLVSTKPRSRLRRAGISALLICAVLAPAGGLAQTSEDRFDLLREIFPEPQATLMILGTFHFADRGLDSFRPEHDVDFTQAEGQRELDDLVSRLARYAPTRVAVEARQSRQPQLDEEYAAYLSGDFELPTSELYQLGFRLARARGHERVWAADAEGRAYESVVDPDTWARENDQLGQLDPLLHMRFDRLYREEDRLKIERPLRETLLFVNDERRLAAGHGNYLIGNFSVGDADNYPGVDAKTAWYNRNLRIFANLLRLAEAKDERILFIVGSGHVPILRHAAQASPEIGLIEVGTVLAD